VILKLTYGIECRSHEDPWIAKSEALHKITALASQPGRWLVDSFPIRETHCFKLPNGICLEPPLVRFIPPFLPGASFLRWAKKSRCIAFDLVRLPYDQIKEDIALVKLFLLILNVMLIIILYCRPQKTQFLHSFMIACRRSEVILPYRKKMLSSLPLEAYMLVCVSWNLITSTSTWLGSAGIDTVMILPKSNRRPMH